MTNENAVSRTPRLDTDKERVALDLTEAVTPVSSALRAATVEGLRTAVFAVAVGIALTALAALGFTSTRRRRALRDTGAAQRVAA